LAHRLWSLSGLLNRGAVHDLKPSESLARLLDDADDRERLLAQDESAGTEIVPRPTPRHAAPETGEPELTAALTAGSGTDTFGEVFHQLLDEHERAAAENAAAQLRARGAAQPPRRTAEDIVPPAPALAAGPGDLVFVFGMRDDAFTVVQALAVSHPGIELAVAGTVERAGFRHVGGRREATQARADGVRRRSGTLVAVGVGQMPRDAEHYADLLGEVVPDQVWIVVDVTRKPEDTHVWAAAVAQAARGVDAVAVIGSADTSTPGSARLLGIPIGWSDGTLA
jgi:hypothetical protein